MHTCMYTCIHTYIQTSIHIYIQTNKQTHPHTDTYAQGSIAACGCQIGSYWIVESILKKTNTLAHVYVCVCVRLQTGLVRTSIDSLLKLPIYFFLSVCLKTHLKHLRLKRLSRTIARLFIISDPRVGTNSLQCLWAGLYLWAIYIEANTPWGLEWTSAAVCCSVLQCNAECCSVLQCVASYTMSKSRHTTPLNK